MRRKLDLDKKTLDDFSILVHGAYACGKTHLQGDFLRWALKQDRGPVGYLTFPCQRGHSTIADMGLGQRGETVDTLKDFEEAVAEFAREKYFALAVDGLYDVYRLATIAELGEFRYPDAKKDGDRSKMLWGQIKLACYDKVMLTKALPYVFWVAPHDRSNDSNEDTVKVGPDLPGKAAAASIGWFDLVGHLTAQTLGPGRVRRRLEVKQSNNVQTRQRFPHEITTDIEIPVNEGGWLAIYGAVQKAMGFDDPLVAAGKAVAYHASTVKDKEGK